MSDKVKALMNQASATLAAGAKELQSLRALIRANDQRLCLTDPNYPRSELEKRNLAAVAIRKGEVGREAVCHCGEPMADHRPYSSCGTPKPIEDTFDPDGSMAAEMWVDGLGDSF